MSNNYFSFIDESGVLDESKNTQPFFAVGFLRILDTSIVNDELIKKHYDYFSIQKEKRRNLLKDLKENPKILNTEELNLLFISTRHSEYKFTNINFTNLEKYKSIIDTALKFPLYFSALVIDKTDPLFNPTIYRNYWHAYIKYTKLLCGHNCNKDDRLCVIADYMNKPNNSNDIFEKEINSLPNVFNTLRAHSETFILLQICDLLLGSVLFEWRAKKGLMKNSNRAKAKKEFVDYLINKLDISKYKKDKFPLAQSLTCHSPIYFSVWPLKLTKKNGGV
ncbi:MAG: hypothetical protein UR54_C0021G0006 [Candidatus Roizmanbacteria bacterium GW2011_GWA2_34_18]|uniref:DUF3800 domain-containing protein n=1 Tax=Candidatus Roizmanbacteria bacterium GW2011_GWA2_34_18 TaxID=1618477 RepID=A0A0G0D9N5_9BACT|nr:MAG: hypothetical protein UR54_C0021G0006 [Candidatus Roizmanbacteria bacterium GW2011_GWA2_34_18]